MSVSVLFGIGVLYLSFFPEDNAEKSFLGSYIKLKSSLQFECTDVIR